MKTITRTIFIMTTALMLTSCASKWERRKARVNYNLMKCQQLCSSGNVTQIEELGCACNLNNRQGGNQSMQNHSPNYSNSTGNRVIIYNTPGNAQNSPSNASGMYGVLGGFMEQERRNRAFYQRANKPVFAPAPVNNYYNQKSAGQNDYLLWD